MPPQDIASRIEAIERKIDAIYLSVEKTRKYFLWTVISSVALFVLPLLGLLFAIPSFLGTYGAMSGAGDPGSILNLDAASNAELRALLNEN